MSSLERPLGSGEGAEAVGAPSRAADERDDRLSVLVAPLAQPAVAGLLSLLVYLARSTFSRTGLQPSSYPYFNFLADAFLHGQLSLRLPPPTAHDLVPYAGKLYLYWPPFPAIVVMPLVALFGVDVSDVLYTALFGAVSIALLARLLAVLDKTGLAPLSVDRRAILVASLAFGSVLLILAPAGRVWFTAQIIGWGCVLLATLAALTQPGKRGYLLVGLALACATATRLSLLFNGLWLAYYLVQRDWRQPPAQRLAALSCGLAPLAITFLLLGWYNLARFGNPFEMGLAWHTMDAFFRPEFERYGAFSIHYLPTNIYYQFIAHPLLAPQEWNMGGGLFWMTPVLLGAPYAVWKGRRSPLVWSLVLSCVLLYIPIGLLMGTGRVTFGPRYLLDLMVPIVVLTALGIRRWPVRRLLILLLISCLTYAVGSWVWLMADYAHQV